MARCHAQVAAVVPEVRLGAGLTGQLPDGIKMWHRARQHRRVMHEHDVTVGKRRDARVTVTHGPSRPAQGNPDTLLRFRGPVSAALCRPPADVVRPIRYHTRHHPAAYAHVAHCVLMSIRDFLWAVPGPFALMDV